MMDRAYLVTILRASGISTSASDDELRSVFSAAGYNEADVARAISIIRTPPSATGGVATQSGMHKILRSNEPLHPSEVSALLGIDMTITEVETKTIRVPRMTIAEDLLVLFLAVTLGVLSLLAVLYHYKIGPFSETGTFSDRSL